MSPSIVIERARIGEDTVTVRTDGDVITHVGAHVPGADRHVDAAGGGVLPGLHDHHIHLLALAAARQSVDVGPPYVRTPGDLDRLLRAAAGAAAPGAWVRAVGYHEASGGALDRDRLDVLTGERPVRVQHATGAMWVLNSSALHRTGLADRAFDGLERDGAGRLTGRCYGLDAEVRAAVPRAPLDLTAVGRELAGYGVTGVTDLTPTEDADELEMLAAAVAPAGYPLDVVVTGGLGLPDDAGLALCRGPVKLVVGDHRLPELDELVAAIRTAHRRGRAAALHCASRVAMVLAVAAFELAGVRSGDRVEHGAVIPAELVPMLRVLRLVVVTQPSFVRDRGDRYLADVEPADRDGLWRCGTLIAAGVGVAGSTDAPYGDPDPWRAVAAALDRRTTSGVVLGPGEAVTGWTALELFLTSPADPAGPVRAVAPGRPARLCLLDRPLAAALRAPSRAAVVATIGRAGLVAAAG